MAAVVSIMIPVYNARPWLAETIDSALAQTWENTEVIVLDDGSTDGSMEVIKRYEGRIRIEQSISGVSAIIQPLTMLERISDTHLGHVCQHRVDGEIHSKIRFGSA